MDNILKNLKEINIFIEDLILLREGETSNTFTGRLNRKKIILKVFKKFNTNFKTNSYLNKETLTELSNKKLHPKVLYKNKTKGILIYEYHEISSCKKDNMFFKKLGKRLKDIHELKNKKNIHTFNEQINTYKKILNANKLPKVYTKLNALIKMSKTNNQQNVFSHNDLNPTNILFNKNICFIDYEYASLNNKFFDISKIMLSFDMKPNEQNVFLESYGIKNHIDIREKILLWKQINLYIDYIWSLIMENIHSKEQNSSKSKTIFNRIKQLEQQIKLKKL
ncbi:MAG: phosphotransferase [Gammaproteobacteria bacterium]|tara:strand:+ start:338 stop:1174 length:837 start_codon:yes stop_codon:yes gene_type:complete